MAKFVVILGFLLAFGAGLVIGAQGHLRLASAEPPPATRPSGPGSWLAAELDLSPDQTQKIDAIWSDIAGKGRGDREDQRRQLRKERDDAIAALIRPEDLSAFDQIHETYADRMAALDAQWREGFNASVERTKQILTPEQRVKYEEILKRHTGGPGARDRQGTRRPSEERATSGPKSER